MASRVGQKIKMTSIDELLCVPETAGTIDINVEAIFPFENHPFKVVDDEKMQDLIDSIKEHGILTPVIVRPDDEGTYEMISGHRRLHAAKRAGLSKIPAIIKEVTDDEATIMMVDANIQREELLLSEKAFAYKMRYVAMKRQGTRSDLTLSQNETRLRADEQLAIDVGESRATVQRIMRLTELIPEFLDMADRKKLPLNTGVELSFLPTKIQKYIHIYIKENGMLQTTDVAALRRNKEIDKLTQEDIIKFFNEMRPAVDFVNKKITLSANRLDKYFPITMTQLERENVIYELLEQWKAEHMPNEEE